jgi:tetratricopeptide (TPR) repeat protein
MGGSDAGRLAGMIDTAHRLETWEAGLHARTEGDPVLATIVAQAWAEARKQGPDDRAKLRAFVLLIRQSGAASVLAGVLHDLTGCLPNAAWAWVLAAEAAAHAGDTGTVAHLAAEMRSRFPALPAAHRLGLEAAVASGRLDQVETLLGALTPEQADEDWALTARIAVAEHQEDHPAALEAGLALAARKPKRPDGALAMIRALSALGRHEEAEQRVAALLPLHPLSGAVPCLAAEIAEARGDHETALLRWADMRKRARNTPVPFLGTLRCLRATNRMDLAMPAIHEALARFPDHEELLVLAARTAESAAQAEDADLFWSRVLRIAPGNAGHALSHALCLIGSPAGRPARMPEVLRRLHDHLRSFPDHEEAFAAAVNAFRTARKPDLAVAISKDWCAAFPASIPLALNRAGAFEDLGDPASALAEIEALRGRVAKGPEIEIAYVRALSVAGKYDEADDACVAALGKYKLNLRLLLEHARVSTRRGDWNQAHDRLVEAQRLVPGNEKIAHELQLLRQQREEAEPDAAPDPAAPNVLARFESLGGTGVSCEFAMIQRQLGADRVGLLRWSRHEVAHLLDGLDAEFEGVGSEESTILKTAKHGPNSEEYVTQDKRYFMESHTFVQTADAPFDGMFRQTCRRLRFLRGKLLEDLRAAERIFLFKAHKPVSDEEAVAMHAALRRYGDNALLCVTRANAAQAPGTLREIGRGIYVGYVGHFLNDDSGNAGSDIPAWQAVCAQADARWRVQAHAVPVPA